MSLNFFQSSYRHPRLIQEKNDFWQCFSLVYVLCLQTQDTFLQHIISNRNLSWHLPYHMLMFDSDFKIKVLC